MNIDTVGRIRPALPGEVQGNLLTTEGNRVFGAQGGQSHSFQILYQQNVSNHELFTKTVHPLLDLFIAGFNTCVLLYGESGSGKSFTMAGDQSKNGQPGIVPQAIAYITTAIQEQNAKQPPADNSYRATGGGESSRPDRARVLMYHYEVYNEVVRDLVSARNTLSGGVGPMELEFTAERGMSVKNLQFEVCRAPADSVTAFWQAWQSRNIATTDFGPASNFTAYVLQLELFMMTDENPLPNRSLFTVVRLPGSEKLSDDLPQARVREGPNLSKSIVALNKLTQDLARQQDPERVINYSDSKMTSLMEDILGGNCKTRVICCLPPSVARPEVMSAVLTGCSLLSQVKNFPIINDCLAQNLVTQYRARANSTLGLAGSDAVAGAGLMSRPELQDQLLKMTSDNTQLRDRNDRLFQRLEQAQEKLTEIAKSKAELSTKLVGSEEDKLKVSKGLVELQLENNRLTEDFESENFDLKNKILTLENQLVEFELERNKFARSHDVSAEHARQLEDNRRKIADEFVALKRKSMEQEKDLEKQNKLNDELRVELAKLIETEAQLLDIRDNVDKRRELDHEAGRELDRARALLRDVSARPLLAPAQAGDDLEQLRARRAHLRHKSMDNQVKLSATTSAGGDDKLLRHVTSAFDKQTSHLQDTLDQLKIQLSAAYDAIETRSQKNAELSTSTGTLKEERDRAIEENSQLQLQVKEANDDYRRRLWKYVQDIADFVDKGPSASKDNRRKAEAGDAMKRKIDEMFKEMKSSFRSREEQLTKAAHNFKKQSKRVSMRHEALLNHYRAQRDQLELVRSLASQQLNSDGEWPSFALGPDPSELALSENELASENAVELNKLRSQLAQLKRELQAAKQSNESAGRVRFEPATLQQPAANTDLHAHAQLERERADLLTRATFAEQRAQEQQDYIDTHLARYKQEIVRLRKILADKGVRVDHASLPPDNRRSNSFRY